MKKVNACKDLYRAIAPLALLAWFLAGSEAVADEYLSSARYYRLVTSAEQGNPEAQYQLALHLHLGREIPKNRVLAYKWYNLADRQGHVLARQTRLLLISEMTSADWDEVRSAAIEKPGDDRKR